MKCPRCSKPVAHRLAACGACGYTLADVQNVYGSELVQMERLHDAAHCLRKRDRDNIEDLLDALERRFPQLFFCAYLGALPEHTRLSELGFWLLNHVTVPSVDVSRPRENGVLLLMDLNTETCGLALGYYVEHFLSEPDLHAVLKAGRGRLSEGNYGTGISLLLKKLGRVLAKRARRIRRLPMHVGGGVLDPFGNPTPLPLLRSAKGAMPLVHSQGDRVFS